MDTPRLAQALLAALLAVATGPQAFSEPKAAPTFKPLFDGEKPLAGWTVRRWDDVSEPAASRWEVEEGILHGGEPRGSWLLSEREYGDFILELHSSWGRWETVASP